MAHAPVKQEEEEEAPAGPDRSRRGLRREVVVAAALRLVDEEGGDALTMRRLARELGVAPMTVYWHVGDRTQLVDAIVADVLGRVAVEAPARGSWIERTASVLEQLRAELLRHPNVVALLAGPGRLTPAVIGTGAGVLELVRELGLDDRRTVEVFRAVVWHALGSVFVDGFVRQRGFYEDPAITRDAVDEIAAALDLGEADGPFVAEVATLDADALFRFGCLRLLEGIQRHAEASP
jgi:TetR/AcrR family transcriptional regulator, tetracycline repressor protein